MERSLDAVYGLGRLAFGAAVLAAPTTVGRALIGKEVGEPAVRTTFRFYGTRDTVLGVGTLRAAIAGDARSWIAAGVMSDVLDVGVQLVEWAALPPDKRAPGIAAAAGAAALGIGLLARGAADIQRGGTLSG